MAYLSRVAALGGDTVEMRGKDLLVNGRRVREPYARHIDPNFDPTHEAMRWQSAVLLDSAAARSYRPSRDNWGPIVVPAGTALLLSDNRDNAYDGRYIGPVPQEQIRFQPRWVYYSRSQGLRSRVRWGRIGARVD